jgi:hypothetical protein
MSPVLVRQFTGGQSGKKLHLDNPWMNAQPVLGQYGSAAAYGDRYDWSLGVNCDHESPLFKRQQPAVRRTGSFREDCEGFAAAQSVCRLIEAGDGLFPVAAVNANGSCRPQRRRKKRDAEQLLLATQRKGRSMQVIKAGISKRLAWLGM